MQLYSNNATSTLLSPLPDDDITVIIQNGAGALFPTIQNDADFFFCTLEKDDGTWEIVKVVAHAAASSTFTVERGAEDSTAIAFLAGDRFEMRLTAGATLQWLQRDGDTIDGGTF